jgi:RNA processing factor Prp31
VFGRRPKRSATFENDQDFINLIDIVAKVYGKLPSEVIRLSWDELYVCIRCLHARSGRAKEAMKTKKKDDIIFPVVNLLDLIDIL